MHILIYSIQAIKFLSAFVKHVFLLFMPILIMYSEVMLSIEPSNNDKNEEDAKKWEVNKTEVYKEICDEIEKRCKFFVIIFGK